jgi:hypothetical protein
VAYPGFFSGGGRGGFQQIQLRTEGRENGDLGAIVPYSRVPLNLQKIETRILIRLLLMYFPWNREFSSALSKLWNFGGLKPKTPPRYATGFSVPFCPVPQIWPRSLPATMVSSKLLTVVLSFDFIQLEIRTERQYAKRSTDIADSVSVQPQLCLWLILAS